MSDDDSSEVKLTDIIYKINWKRELILIVIGGIIGGVVFTMISPFIVPTIHDFQVNQLGAQNPVLGVEVEYRALFRRVISRL